MHILHEDYLITYQDASTDAFGVFDSNKRSYDMDENYVDGISLTHGINP